MPSLFSILVVYHSVLIPVVIHVLDIVIVLQRVNELLHVLQWASPPKVSGIRTFFRFFLFFCRLLFPMYIVT